MSPIAPGSSNPYFAFTDACNCRRSTVILASGQACVWYRLTLASKDGDWIVREEPDALATVLSELERLGARYRLGAPLDVRWLKAGWSSHFEALGHDGLRLRFDFVSRPPRLPPDRLQRLWSEVEAGQPAIIGREDLIRIKQTMRLKDYAFIGSLALQLDDPETQLRWTLDPDHLLELLERHPELRARLNELRPACALAEPTPDALAACIDGEIRTCRRADERRLQAYGRALSPWAERFRSLDLMDVPLRRCHDLLCAQADGLLPQEAPSWS